jgi:hypothetical protein
MFSHSLATTKMLFIPPQQCSLLSPHQRDPLVLSHIASPYSTSSLECSHTITTTTYFDNSDDGLWWVWVLRFRNIWKKKTSKVGEWSRYGGLKQI